MPPVEHVPLHELVARMEQDLLARNGRRECQERERVLELVAESERAARLVERRASPDPTAQRLVRQPRVHHEVELGRRRLDLGTRDEVVPPGAGAGERRLDRCGVCESREQLGGLRLARALAEHERQLARLVSRQLERDPPRETWIVERAGCAVERGRGAERVRSRRVAVAPEERRAVGGVHDVRVARHDRARERDRLRPLPRSRVAGEHRSARAIARGDDASCSEVAGAEDEPRVGDHDE
jgi:hypothetical protein